MSLRAREPEAGQAGEDTTFVGDVGREHDVEGGDAVAGDEQQPLVVEGVELANLAATNVQRGIRHGLVPPSGRGRAGGQRRCRRAGRSLRGRRRPSRSTRPAISGSARTSSAKSRFFLPGAHRMALDEPVGIVACKARVDEREQEPVAEDEPVARVEVPPHSLRIDDETFDDPGEAVEHVVECEEGVGNDDALGGGLRDVALVPERDVLQADERVRAQDARKPADALGHFRVPLVRHRGGALHPFAERLLDLAHLGARQVADLRRESLERRGCERQRREQFGVTVAGDHLCRERVRLQSQSFAGETFDVGVDLRVRPDRPGELADAIRLQCASEARASRGRARTPSRRASSRTLSARHGCRASGRCKWCAGAPQPERRPLRVRGRSPRGAGVLRPGSAVKAPCRRRRKR